MTQEPIVLTRRDRRALTRWISEQRGGYDSAQCEYFGQVVTRVDARPVVVGDGQSLTPRETLHRLRLPANLFEDAPGERYRWYGSADRRNVCVVEIMQRAVGDAEV